MQLGRSEVGGHAPWFLLTMTLDEYTLEWGLPSLRYLQRFVQTPHQMFAVPWSNTSQGQATDGRDRDGLRVDGVLAGCGWPCGRLYGGGAFISSLCWWVLYLNVLGRVLAGLFLEWKILGASIYTSYFTNYICVNEVVLWQLRKLSSLVKTNSETTDKTQKEERRTENQTQVKSKQDITEPWTKRHISTQTITQDKGRNTQVGIWVLDQRRPFLAVWIVLLFGFCLFLPLVFDGDKKHIQTQNQTQAQTQVWAHLAFPNPLS